MRRDVEFNADGVTLRGWLYTPDGASGPGPTVVMTHGFSAVEEMYLDRFAAAFVGAGPGALHKWFVETHETRAPSWRNETTLRSVEMFSEYEPGTYLPSISPTPLLMMPAQNDVLTPTDLAPASQGATGSRFARQEATA